MIFSHLKNGKKRKAQIILCMFLEMVQSWWHTYIHFLINLRWINPQTPWKHTFEFMNGFSHIVLLLSRSSNALRANKDQKPFYEEYLECVSEFMNGYVVERFIAARYAAQTTKIEKGS